MNMFRKKKNTNAFESSAAPELDMDAMPKLRKLNNDKEMLMVEEKSLAMAAPMMDYNDMVLESKDDFMDEFVSKAVK